MKPVVKTAGFFILILWMHSAYNSEQIIWFAVALIIVYIRKWFCNFKCIYSN